MPLKKPQHFHVFSYGSNMLIDRIRNRVSTVEPVGLYELRGFELVFNKAGKDGSAKANMRPSHNSSTVHGVIQRFDLQQKPLLDEAEGLGRGYELMSFKTVLGNRNSEVHYYIARDSKYLTKRVPFDWYWDYVYYGALENQLPDFHLETIKEVPFVIDQNIQRRKHHDTVLEDHRRAYSF
ncbi:MAG: gamma-glutamylcyclotransferase family protein [Bacteroidota bacterium]